MKRLSEPSKKIVQNELLHKNPSTLQTKLSFHTREYCTSLVCKTKELIFKGITFKRDYATITSAFENYPDAKKPYNTPPQGVQNIEGNDPIPTIHSSYGQFHYALTSPCKIPGKVIMTGRLTTSGENVIDPSSGKEITPEFLSFYNIKGLPLIQYVVYFEKPLLVHLTDLKFSQESTNYLNQPHIKAIIEPIIDDLCKDIQNIL